MVLDEFLFSFHQTLGLAYWMWEVDVARVGGRSSQDWPKSLSDWPTYFRPGIQRNLEDKHEKVDGKYM